ncbi:MAG: nitrogen regulation protein NR(II) [Candidatus Margulisiibacteriota bacterium]
MISPVFTLFCTLAALGVLVLLMLFKWRTFEGRVLISRSAAFVISGLLFSTVCLSFIFAYHYLFLAHIDLKLTLLVIAGGWFTVFLFDPLRRHLQTHTDQFFLKKDQLFEQLLLPLSNELTKCSNLEDLVYGINTRTQELLGLTNCQLFLNASYFENFAPYKNELCAVQLSNGKVSLDHRRVFKHNSSVLHQHAISESPVVASEELLNPLPDKTTALFCVCATKAHLYAVVCLGHKLSEEQFSLPDLHVIKLLTLQLTTVLQRLRPFALVKKEIEHNVEMASKMNQQMAYASITQGIAHEIRNPLGMILSGNELILDNLDNPEKIAEYANLNIKNILRLNTIITTMLKYVHPSSQQKQIIHLNEVLDDILLVGLGKFRQKNIQVEKEIDTTLQPVFAELHAVYQALLAVIINAIEASSANGVIKIQTTKERFIDLSGAEKTGVKIIIQDFGDGIEDTIQHKIFDPFFTTKYENPGLGLSTAQRMLGLINGKIDVQSKRQEGTEVSLYIPFE